MSRLHGFTKKQILEVYSKMVLARILDEKMLILLKQGKGYFHIGSSGHEAAQLAAASVMRSGEDWSFPYYRDATFCLGIGMTSREQLLSFLAKADDPNSGGRQMPQHYGHTDLRIVSQSSPTGTQYLQAVGCAMSRQMEKTKEVVYVSSGEGTTSQGDFHEALNWASNAKAPVIFHIQDNEYAISTHKSHQTADSVYAMAAGYKNLSRFEVNGTDFFETNLAFKQASERARKGKGPSIIVSNVVRLLPHSSSDDQRKYRTEEALAKDKARDPLLVLENQCIKEKFIAQKEFDSIHIEVKKQVDADAEWAEKQAFPSPETALDHIYSDEPVLEETELNPISDKIVMVDAINHALKEEMSRNDKMVIYGQDIADPKGGVFTVTKELSKLFGKERVFNSPLAESSIVGTAIGLAVTGFKPVVEIQFGDYIWTAMMQLRNEVASIRYRSNNQWTAPIVFRVPVGGYIHGALCHSQSIDGYFIHLPGIYLAYPSNAADAKGLLKMACRMDDPVIFMEHKGLYRQGYAATEEPDENYILPFGKAKFVREGTDLTIITWGAMVQKSIEAAQTLEAQDASIEIIDLRTLNPLDLDTIEQSLKKTGKALVVYEDNLTNGPGAEISALIADRFFEYLDGPIRRVATKDSPIPYNWFLEEKILAQTQDISEAITELLEY
ncbi:MAG: tungsten formylmethanofuran dehydrogenase [Candidatus Marinimicrobia bacterium]|jgi:2-oxoisovalerate dehydrogenase E1 component|nr:tungsten formylmethanofuran dehydrogenase [Candidatus Neomarinimicrobiota bacterium]MBT3496563.1 tungsten formylmethanofuran dehydrogenase [Candidatus Neomarinimicrobiota bacterium]MBT3692768.1 tungsten formylmethanofuran dehydrogenase [Candidatus Neomarinimicrobiota bacterium]MBT3731586.1 tungsten formylmethanofuran dehydrogenase [Candidatus Neomarinimicrobiota bacterium]MBT4145222.1 tungsten formylmethanofuran dehydrogenase [Candidatus Neomarinimicrobiota bacterium]